MKRFLLFSAILLMVVSCSKENFDKKENQITKSTAGLESAAIKLNLDSIARMNAGAFLKSDLTALEIDSILKNNSRIMNKSNSTSTIAGEEYTDASGFIHFRIFLAQSPSASHNPHAEAMVSDDYVLVGGGAAATNYQFLYESRPDDQLTKWIASSKDHIISNPHYITAYAIGMKIDGVTPEYLKSKIHLYSSTSPQPVNQPDWTVAIPSNLLLIGGGALDNWEDEPMGYGNMLTASYPISSSTWRVAGKDHRRADPSTITAYAIGIEDISYPNVGYLQVSAIYVMSDYIAYFGYATTPIDISTGWTLTCSGGQVTYYGAGRMMCQNFPYSLTRSILQSSDSYSRDTGYNYSWALIIQGGF